MTKKQARFDETAISVNHEGNDPCSRKRRRRRRQQPLSQLPGVEDFMTLEVSHPYGILPGGNQFTTNIAESTRQSPSSSWQGESNFFLIENEEVCSHILSFCDGADLARVAQCCRFLYAASHQLELWRDLVLRLLLSSSQSDNKSSGVGVLDQVMSTWKDSYVLLLSKKRDKSSVVPHVPMVVPGVYSDYYYRLHSCRTFSIPKQWLEEPSNCFVESSSLSLSTTVQRVSYSEMTPQRFYDEFEGPNRPVVVTGATDSWKASQKWSSREEDKYLREQMKGRDFRATSGAAPLPAQFTFSTYYDYCHWDKAILEEAPLYLFDRTALCPQSVLWHDFHPDLQRTCPYWDSAACPQHDLFALLEEGRRPDHTWLIMGPKRSGSVFHIDPNCTHAWNATIRGRKRWIFYPPGVPPPGVHPSDDADSVALPLTTGEWLFQFWPEHVDRLLHAPPSERPLECTSFPGDVVFVPHGWWHMVINLDDGLNIAITHNYVSRSNLSDVLKFLHEKEDQISGCRDRPEALQPNQLYNSFVECLQNKHPKWLADALAVPHWTCRAWTDATAAAEARNDSEPMGNKSPHHQDSSIIAQATENSASSPKINSSIITRAKSSSSGNNDEAFSFSFSF